VDSQGRLVVGWTDQLYPDQPGYARAARWDGNRWTVLGAPVGTPGGHVYDQFGFALGPDDQPWFAIRQAPKVKAQPGSITVARYTGTEWHVEAEHLAVIGGNITFGVSLAVDASGEPFVGWTEYDRGNLVLLWSRAGCQ
jgi:hypothetical protein